MTRTAPLMTLLAVGVLGGALVMANTLGAQDGTTAAQGAAVNPAAPAAPAAPALPAGDVAEVDLGDVPVAPGEDGAAPAAPLADGVYAGRAAGRALTVAIAIDDGEAGACLCSGGEIEFCLSGTATADGLDLVTADGAATMTGVLVGDTFAGTITAEDDEWVYLAEETTVEDAAAAGREDVVEVADQVGP